MSSSPASEDRVAEECNHDDNDHDNHAKDLISGGSEGEESTNRDEDDNNSDNSDNSAGGCEDEGDYAADDTNNRSSNSFEESGRLKFESLKREYELKGSSKLEIIYRQAYLVLFLLSIYVSNISNLVSTLVPIITQPEDTMSGNNLDFGKVLVREDILIDLGFTSSDYTISGIDASNDLFLVDLSSIDGTTVLSGKSYDEAFNIAKSINEGHLEEVGGCTSVDASGGLSGSTSLVQYSCAPYTVTTRNEMNRWIDLEESKCVSNYIALTDLFHDCMLFGSHNPGSMYIIAGEATAKAGMDCTYPLLEIYSWNINTGLSLSSKLMNNHVLQCTGDLSTQISHGFITQEYMSIYQTWPYYSEHFAFEKKCIDDLGGQLSTSNMWSGDVELGLQQIFVFCSSKGYLDGKSCWDFIFDSFDPDSESWSTWKAFSESPDSYIKHFPQYLVESAFDKDIKYSDMWHSFSEIVLNWNTTGPTISGTSYYANSSISDYTVSSDAFRRTFGWGWDLYPTIIGSAQWEVTTKALYSTSSLELFPIGTQHTVELSCISPSNTILDEDIMGDNYRASGTVILVPYWSKLTNAFMMVLSMGLALLVSSSNRLVKFFAFDFFGRRNDGGKTRKTLSETYFLIGIVSVVVEGGTYLFESAIPNHLSTSCNMKVTSILDNPAVVIIDSFVNRWTVAGLSVVLTQMLCWLQNSRGILATGTMPRHISALLMSIGFFYAVALSISSIIANDSCASEINLYFFDLLFPAVVSLFAVSFMTSCMTHDGRFNLVCRYEGDRYRFLTGEEDDLDNDDTDDALGAEEATALLLATSNEDSEPKLSECDLEMVGMGEGTQDMLPPAAFAITANDASCGNFFALYSAFFACSSSNSHRNDPNVVLFARPCPFSLENNSEMQEDFRPYGIYTNGYMFRTSPIVLTFDGAISLSNFNADEEPEWPTMENGETVDYTNDRCFRMVQKSLSCAGVMSTTATVELKYAQEAKRSSKQYGARRRESLGRERLRTSMIESDSGPDHADEDGHEDSNEGKVPLRWDHLVRISFAALWYHLNPLGLLINVFLALIILCYIFNIAALLLSLPLILVVLCMKFIRFIRGQDRFRVLRCLFTRYSQDYEGQLDNKSRPHGFGKIYFTDDKSQFFEGVFKHGKADGYGRLIFERKLEYKSLMAVWDFFEIDFFLLLNDDEDGNYAWTSDILGSLGVHRSRIENVFRVHDHSWTISEAYFRFVRDVVLSEYEEICGVEGWWALDVNVPKKKKESRVWHLEKDVERLQIEYSYKEGIPSKVIRLTYDGEKRVEVDAESIAGIGSQIKNSSGQFIEMISPMGLKKS